MLQRIRVNFPLHLKMGKLETVRIRSNDANEKAFSKEVRKEVNQYFIDNNISPKGNFTLYFKAFIMLSLYLVPFILVLTDLLNPMQVLLCAVIMGIGEAGVGMSVMHDGAHNAFSNKKWLNKLAASTMWLMGSNTFNWKIQHNLKHHTFTNIFDHDEDISTKAVIRLSKHAPHKKYQKFQHIYAFPLFGFLTMVRLFGEILILIDINKKGITKQHATTPAKEMFYLILIKVIYLTAFFGLPLYFTDFTFGQIVIGFLVVHFVASFILATVFQLAHVVEGADEIIPDKDNIVHSEWYVHQLETTSDFGRNNGLFSWYIGGLDYQIEHHLFQNISHVHYPAIAPIVEKTAKKYGFNYNLKPTVFHALKSNYIKLKELGKG